MERLQGPINPCFLDLECLESAFAENNLRFVEEQEEEEYAHFSMPSLEDNKMPFLQMLQSAEAPPFFAFKEPNFQTLLKLQHFKKPWNMSMNMNNCNYNMPETKSGHQIQALEQLESCVTHDAVLDLHSPVKSETKDFQNQNPHNSSSCLEAEQQLNSSTTSLLPWTRHPQIIGPNETTQYSLTKSNSHQKIAGGERRKRKRTRQTKNKEEVEKQRMTHITVERNRRRQMNDHLNSLRSLMPPSYVQRGDQASIIGGAIDFVKELEQLLHSLEAQKRLRRAEETICIISQNGLFPDMPQGNSIPSSDGCENCLEETAKAKKMSEVAEIEVTAVQNHVNLKVRCERRPGQLLSAIVALEGLRLTVLHLNITSSQATVLYSFNLKMEEDCSMGSADEVATAVHQIFSIINGSGLV